jgi:hypothetical protein
MNKKNIVIPFCIGIAILFASMVGCSSKHEDHGQVIEKSSSSTTTVERPVSQERKTTTTTTESR